MSLLRKLFGTSGNPPDATKLDGTSEAALGRSLSALPAGERGWITFAEARTSFSTKDAEYACRKAIESFAARHQSVISFMPVEARVYFVRSQD